MISTPDSTLKEVWAASVRAGVRIRGNCQGTHSRMLLYARIYSEAGSDSQGGLER